MNRIISHCCFNLHSPESSEAALARQSLWSQDLVKYKHEKQVSGLSPRDMQMHSGRNSLRKYSNLLGTQMNDEVAYNVDPAFPRSLLLKL